jgi:hypothetical protein
MNKRWLAVRISFVVLVAAGIATGAGAVRAAVVGAQLGVDRSGIDGDTPPNTQYTEKINNYQKREIRS